MEEWEKAELRLTERIYKRREKTALVAQTKRNTSLRTGRNGLKKVFHTISAISFLLRTARRVVRRGRSGLDSIQEEYSGGNMAKYQYRTKIYTRRTLKIPKQDPSTWISPPDTLENQNTTIKRKSAGLKVLCLGSSAVKPQPLLEESCPNQHLNTKCVNMRHGVSSLCLVDDL
jgi:hypothetical protein